jgi:hypothetical protein
MEKPPQAESFLQTLFRPKTEALGFIFGGYLATTAIAIVLGILWEVVASFTGWPEFPLPFTAEMWVVFVLVGSFWSASIAYQGGRDAGIKDQAYWEAFNKGQKDGTWGMRPEEIAEAKRPKNECDECGHTWYPRGAKISSNCPQCRSEDVLRIDKWQ